MLGSIPHDFPLPILIVEHQLPGSKSLLPSILDRSTALTVKQAEDGETARPGTVYVAPTDTHLVIGAGRRLELLDSAPERFQRPSANVLFQSLAEHVDGAAVVIVLSGMGRDGAEGAVAVKEAGGRVMAGRRSVGAVFRDARSGHRDRRSRPGPPGRRDRRRPQPHGRPGRRGMSTELDPGFEELLDFVHEARGFDYSQYKRPSLMRRFEKRMQTAGVDTYEDYRSYLEAEPREFAELLDQF